MKTTSFEDFRRRARTAEGSGVPVVVELPWLWSPEEWFGAVRHEERPFLLESSTVHPKNGRWSYVGCSPFLIFESKGGRIRMVESGTARSFSGSAIAELRGLLKAYYAVRPPDPIPFAGGAVGFFSYDAGRHFERLPEYAEDDLETPDIAFGFYDEVVVFDHARSNMYLCITVFDHTDLRGAYNKAMERISAWTNRAKGPKWSAFRTCGPTVVRTSEKEFKRGVRKALDFIASGDIFQVNLSQRFDTPVEGDAFSLYRTLRDINASPFGGYLEWGGTTLVSSSPERLVAWDGTWALTRPIAGTAPRGISEFDNLANRETLILNPKERAEHLMLVDLERNDLGRVSEFGSVRVGELMTLEEYSHVIHIVSEVRGKTRPGVDALDIIRALFPGGTITGTPKVRAMEIIEEIEPVRRGAYTGSMGFIGFSGTLDLNIIIRTFVLKGGQATVQVGAGIVADSNPDREYQETLHKGRALFEALKKCRENTAVIPS